MMEPLLDRLLVDAEARAARREPREALLLLRWAATIASRTMMPRVLLAYHRIRALNMPLDHQRAAMSEPEPVQSDRLGFPVPRFASRPPELDRTSFVPAPRFLPESRSEPRGDAAAGPRPQARIGGMVSMVILIAATAAAGAVLQHVRPADGARRAAAKAAAAAVRLGNPNEALAILDRVDDLDPRLLALRGRAHLALADTQAAVAAFKLGVAHRAATAEEMLSGARELARLPCCASAAAEAYMMAFERGIESNRFEEIAKHLDGVGRSDQAVRIRELGRGPR
jgi:hypothetical protein